MASKKLSRSAKPKTAAAAKSKPGAPAASKSKATAKAKSTATTAKQSAKTAQKPAAAKARAKTVAPKAEASKKPAKQSASKQSAAKPAEPVKLASRRRSAPANDTPRREPVAAAAGPGIQVGDSAPSFVLQDDSGTVVSSESLRGAPYVLYFYPKDDTPGCTLEACGFRDSMPRFAAKGVRVLGVSADSPESHARFKKKYGLSFPLLSDPEKTLAKAYGVWVKKQNYGREYMGVERSTFVVDRKGTVREVWRAVRVPGHVDTVLDAV